MERNPEEVDSNSAVGPGLARATSTLERFNQRFDPIVRGVMYVGAAILFLWTCFMFVDVLLRYVFNRPIPGSIDITSLVLVFLTFFAVAYTQLQKGHITVDLVTSKLTPRAELALSTAMYIISTAIIGVLVWRGVLNTIHYHNIGAMGPSGISFLPGAAAVPFGGTFLFVTFLRDLITKIVECVKLRIGVVTWVLMLVLPVLFMVLALLAMYQILTGVNPSVVGAFCILLLFVLIFLGMPVAFALFVVTVTLMGYAAGPTPGWIVIGSALYTNASNYAFSVVPLYILMSYFILVGELGTAAFFGAYKWVGHYRGGLGMAVIGGSAALAAVVGAGTAGTVTMGLVAYPEMKKYKYDDGLATGAIAAGATLGPIIPPSLVFIVYGILTQESIGDLFIAGIIPGILLALSFVAWIIIATRINPSLGPAAARASWGERIRAIPVFGPILVLFLIIIGGIYAGVFTAMEGGGIGAFCAFIIALASKHLSWKKFKSALADSMKFIGMLMFVILGGLLLSNSLGMSGISSLIVEFCQELGVSPVVLVAVILFVYVLFGMICDAPIIIILTIPILAPMLKAMGVDLIWFGVLCALIGGLGTISPPFAIGIFMLRSIAAPDLSLGTMYRGIIPFCVCTLIIAILILFIPGLAIWLPGLMR